MKRLLLVLLIASCAFGQGSSVHPYTSPLWRTFLDGTTAEFQADSDSTTFFQILDADGGTPIVNVDSTNERVGINMTGMVTPLEIPGSTTNSSAKFGAYEIQSFAVNNCWLTDNIYFDGSNFKYRSNGLGVLSNFFQGGFQVRTVDTGLAGNIAVTRARLIVLNNGNVGFRESNPETAIEITYTTPYITLHNSTHEDTDGDGESRIIGKREDGAGTETAAGQIEISHDGAGANDQLGKITDYVNTGAGLVASRELDSNGDESLYNGAERRYYDSGNSNYVGFKAPALTGDQIWTLPDADGADGDVMFTDGSGNLKWGANASTRAFTFSSPSGGSGTTYAGGHYRFGATDNDFNPSITFGIANGAYGDHIFIVAVAGASGGTDTVIRVTGTSITDAGVRSAADTEDLTADDAGAAGAYYETAKKWIGQITIEKQSGPDLLCNYGGAKYWDDNNEDFKVEGVDVTWLGGANDANPNLILRHHKATGWTYNAGAAPTPPTAIDSMNSDYVTEIQVISGEEGAWKRTNLSVNVGGSGSEGTLIEIVTTANKTFEIGNFLMRVVPQ